MNRIIAFLLVLYCIFPLTKISANGELDSLLTIVDQSEIGSSIYFNTLIQIVKKYDGKVSINLDSLTDLVISNAIKLDSHSYHIKGLDLEANTFTGRQEFDKALLSRQKAIEISQKEKFYREEAFQLMEIAIVKAYASDKYDSGFPEMEKSMLICKEHDFKDLLVKDYFAMSYFYGALYDQKAFFPEVQETKKYQDYLKKSIEYIDKAIALATELNDKKQIGIMQGQRVVTLLYLKAYQEAIDQANETLDSKRKRPLENIAIQNEYIDIARGYYGLNKLNQANIYLDSAKQIVIEAKLMSFLVYINEIEVQWAMAGEDYKKALDLTLDNEALKDSVMRRNDVIYITTLSCNLSFKNTKYGFTYSL